MPRVSSTRWAGSDTRGAEDPTWQFAHLRTSKPAPDERGVAPRPIAIEIVRRPIGPTGIGLGDWCERVRWRVGKGRRTKKITRKAANPAMKSLGEFSLLFLAFSASWRLTPVSRPRTRPDGCDNRARPSSLHVENDEHARMPDP